MTEKDVTITITAYQKSVIESGAKPEDWADLTKRAVINHTEIKKWIMGNNKEK